MTSSVNEWIDADAALASLCAALDDVALVAIDTEFVREKTYYPQLCLIQVAAPGKPAHLGFLSAAHTAEDVDEIVAAHETALAEMKDRGFF